MQLFTVSAETLMQLNSKYLVFEGTPSEYNLRKQIFIENVRGINAFNMENHSYKQGINQFTDQTDDETFKMLSYSNLEDPFDIFAQNFSDVKKNLNPEKTPSKIDWRNNNGVNYVGAVRNQGHCGSCYAFASLGSLESHLVINKVFSEIVLLSEQQLVDCLKHDCHGLNYADAFTYIKKQGVVSDADYPYVSGDLKQANKCTADFSKVIAKITGYVKVKGEDDLKTSVGQNGPTTMSICSHAKTFSKYKSGVYDDPDCESEEGCKGRHATLAVGYGTDENGKDYWIVKNSWGDSWGENGYFRLARGVGRCKVGYSCAYPTV